MVSLINFNTSHVNVNPYQLFDWLQALYVFQYISC